MPLALTVVSRNREALFGLVLLSLQEWEAGNVDDIRRATSELACLITAGSPLGYIDKASKRPEDLKHEGAHRSAGQYNACCDWRTL